MKERVQLNLWVLTLEYGCTIHTRIILKSLVLMRKNYLQLLVLQQHLITVIMGTFITWVISIEMAAPLCCLFSISIICMRPLQVLIATITDNNRSHSANGTKARGNLCCIAHNRTFSDKKINWNYMNLHSATSVINWNQIRQQSQSFC